jgi:tRNA nucleotidyltransferase (CCA-adding enzyme)
VKRLDEAPSLARFALYLASSDAQLRGLLRKYNLTWKELQPTVDGHTLRSLGIPPGPSYRLIINKLRDAWLDGEICNQDQEKELMQKLLNSERG